jgi:hypothetical protein
VYDNANGAQIHSSRIQRPGNQFPVALTPIFEPTELVIVGQTDAPLGTGGLSGANDVFVASLATNFSVSVPPTSLALVGSQRVGGVSRDFSSRSIIIGGGSNGASAVACSGTYSPFDSMVLRVGLAASSATLSSSFVVESPSAILPAVQIDDWIESVGPGGQVVGTVARQFDCFSGGAGYIDNDAIQIVQLSGSGFGNSRSKLRPGFTGTVNVSLTGEVGTSVEDYHLFADGVAWKFDSRLRAEAFGVSIPAGLASVSASPDGVTWIGNANGLSRFILK